MRKEWVGKWRRAGNSFAIFIPAGLRKTLGWHNGDYLIIVPHGNLLMITKVDKQMLIERNREPGSVESFSRETP